MTPPSWVAYAARTLQREREQRPEPYESPVEILPSPTWHLEREPLPDGTIIEWPVLDGPLPSPVIGEWDDEDCDHDR